MKIVKVFTKYDELYQAIYEQYFDDLTAQPMSSCEVPIKRRDYRPAKIEYGENGVRFVTYENV